MGRSNQGRSQRSYALYLTVFLFLGEVINEKDRCKKCEGKKVIKEVKILEVHVDKGMKHGQRITFTGEADQAPGVEPGDIVLLLQEKEHEVICPLKSKAIGTAGVLQTPNYSVEFNPYFIIPYC